MDASERFMMGVVALTLLCGGCSTRTPRGEDPAVAARAETSPNGTNFNGTNFNGVRLDPLRFDGLRLGTSALSGVSLDGAAISAALPGGGRASGSDLAGAELAGTLSDGSAITLRIDGVTADPDPDVQRYQVSARAAGAAFQPLCGVAADGTPVPAIPLAGWWDASEGTPTGGAHVDDPDVFTFACEGYALAKCVGFGYAPWRTVNECRAPGDCVARSLAPLHQACTRMLRADYCGDGTATTRDGTQVDLWDDLGIQTDVQPTWAFEAEWSAAGAVCVDETRWTTLPDGEATQGYVQTHCPAAWQATGCGGGGSSFFTASGFDAPLETRALLRTRIASQL